MNAEEARQVDAVLRRLGLPGVVAPEDPADPGGEWRVYDQADPETRTETTADALVGLATAYPGEAPPSGSARGDQRGPTRGFVLPPTDG
ncbi:hypothetical protein RM844_30870 [Streptomyces sp. DSM 44915]|uniref:Uncharacterized protein n=1 Tax=Streptomyces chisholmiae TaxID=3075540 RepID=A0ABU2K2G0_9ACTN|nr:hypothetical protein [Streptomyces sp. DSM 44915]MDT0270683.1 hypothetical protein [Streptomyces sp. DSM 44915]